MNVDFSNDNSQLEMHESALQVSAISEHVYSMPNAEPMQEASSFSSENQGNIAASDRLVMPKRPHNVNSLTIIIPFYISLIALL